MDAPRPQDTVDLDWLLAAVRTMAQPAAAGLSESYAFHLDHGSFRVVAEDGTIAIQRAPRPDTDADVTITCDVATFIALGLRRLSPLDAIEDGRLEVAGDPQAALRAIEILSPLPAANRDVFHRP